MPPFRKSRLVIFGAIVAVVGGTTCMVLIFLALAGIGGLLPLGVYLFGAGLVLMFIAMGILVMYLILELTRAKPISQDSD